MLPAPIEPFAYARKSVIGRGDRHRAARSVPSAGDVDAAREPMP